MNKETWRELLNRVHPTDRAIDKQPLADERESISLVYDYTSVHLDSFAAVLDFMRGTEMQETLPFARLGKISQREPADWQFEGEFVRLANGTILGCLLVPEHYYTENTTDPAKVYFQGWRPK